MSTEDKAVTKREELARAAHRAGMLGWTDSGEVTKEDCYRIVDAILDALREPSKGALHRAAMVALVSGVDQPPQVYWQAMIDHIKEEKV